MKIVIDIDDEDYKRIQGISDVFNSLTSRSYSAIRNGTPLSDGAEILTKEAYSDLCTRAADVPENARKRTKTHACVCISRQAAIDALDNVSANYAGKGQREWHPHIDFMIDAINKVPSVEPERKSDSMTVDDYRDRMIEAFHNADCDELIALIVLPSEKEFEHLEWLLKNHYRHSVPERKTGKWLLLSDDEVKKMWAFGQYYSTVWMNYKCSSCGKIVHNSLKGYEENRTRYCPKCGAQMEVNA